MQISQINALRVLWGMVLTHMAIGAAKWPCAPPRLSNAAARGPPPPYLAFVWRSCSAALRTQSSMN
eukprot:3820679-Pleurochrysis_carterae.AAC.1